MQTEKSVTERSTVNIVNELVESGDQGKLP